MKKTYIWSILTLIITTFLPSALLAQKNTSASGTDNTAQHETHVTPAQALNVGYTFMRTGDGSKGNGTQSGNVSKQAMQLVYTGQSYDSLTGTVTDCYYVFALQPKGFVIVAADDRVEPILGYSYDNDFVVENIPDHVRGWLGNYERQIQTVVKNNLQTEPATETKWARLKSGQAMSTRSGESVGPLITTTWDQVWPYNAMCPEDSLAGADYHFRCPTGCTATATAQIMNYWQYPAKGIGHHSYKTKSGIVDKQSASFNETYYQWDSMDVNHVVAISTLMYHVGVALDMDYMPGGSAAYLSSAENGLQRYFDYSDSSVYLHRGDFDDSSWIQMLKLYITNNKPILYEGGSTSPHAWVIDGYDNQDLFHMNFGWGGYSDGYYSINELSSIGLFNFNDNQGAVLGLCPAYSPLDADFEVVQDSVLKFIFYDFSKGAPNQHKWYFGDGDSSIVTNPVHKYDTTGLLHVAFIVGNGTINDTIIKEIAIDNKPLVPVEKDIRFINRYFPPLILDYDMDGLYDFYISGCFRQELYHNGGDDFQPNTIVGNLRSATAPCKPSIVDFLHENRPSILSGETDGYYFYNHNGTLKRMGMPVAEFEYMNPIFMGDYNGDGEEDILLAGVLYENIGNYNFVRVADIYNAEHENNPKYLWVDYDGDGDLDIVGHSLFRNDGEAGFVRVPSIEHSEDHPFDFISETADFNNDGLIDFLENDAIWLNQGNDNFIKTTVLYSGGSIVADINADGITDILAPNGYDSYNNNHDVVNIWTYKQETDEFSVLFSMDNSFEAHSFIDFDHNNLPDVVGIVGYWENHCGIANNHPSIPQNLWTTVDGNSVVLHWDTVSDDHSRFGSITYNIMVGTSPDSFNIKSPLSNIETGERYAYDRGNAGHAPLWKMNNLPNGTYFWRVQAIDNSFAASPFSATGSFVINGQNLPPQMSTITVPTVLNRKKDYLSSLSVRNHYTDKDKDSLQGFVITKLPEHGLVYLRDSLVTVNQYISYNEIDSLRIIPLAFQDDSMYVKPFDGTHYADKATLIRFHVLLFEQSFSLDGVSGDVAWGDFDNDGKVDFACTSGIYHNMGTGFEQLADSVPFAEKVTWADVNNDGWLDCLFDGFLLTNMGNGHFSWDNPLLSWNETGVSVGDLNNDNKVDYIISGASDSWTETASRIYYNNGNTLSNDSMNNSLQGFRFGDIAVGDFDNDGKQDIVMNGFDYDNHRNTILFKNDGETLQLFDSTLRPVNTGSLSWMDFDKDGDLDLLLSGTEGDFDHLTTTIYENSGTGAMNSLAAWDANYNVWEYVPWESYTSIDPICLGKAVWFDFDNDGYMDVLLSGMTHALYHGIGTTMPRTQLLRNIDGVRFERIENTNIPDLAYSSIDVADYDGDGYEDVIISGRDKDNNPFLGIFSNGLGTSERNNPMQNSSPTDLSSEVYGSAVTLTWSDSVSETYNVYVRDSSGYMVSPLSDISTGFRKVTDYGNAGTNDSYILKHLSAGTYYWSVQGIDKTHKGGLFAPEHSFTIECAASDTTIAQDTAYFTFTTQLGVYRQSGVYYETYPNVLGCDSIVERHVTILTSPIVYVRKDGKPTNNGFSWSSALSDLQEAINLAAEFNCQVWVAKGIYYGDGVSENAFEIPEGVHVYGGFVGDEPEDYNLTLRNLSRNLTILDGQHSQRTVYGVWILHGTPAILDGFTIRNGFAIGVGGNVNGGGFVHIDNCIVRDGEAVFEECCAEGGGAYWAILSNTIVINNSADHGGAISESQAINCTFVGNSSSEEGTILLWSTLANCILWHNNGFPLDITEASYSAFQGLQVEGIGNICLAYNNDGNSPDSNYVRFLDPENELFQLNSGSVCIDAGTMYHTIMANLVPEFDIQGWPRMLQNSVDMGAYEYYPVPVVETYDTICEGNSVTLNGTEYGNGGTYTVHTHPDPMQDTMYMLHLTVNPNPSVTISGNTEFCAGGSTTLYANVTPDQNASYVWYKDGAEMALYTPSITVTDGGVYTVEATVNDCQATDNITINVNDIPATPVVAVDNATIFDGGQVTLSVTNPIPEAIYTWYRNGVLIPYATQASLVEYLSTVDGDATIYTYAVVAALNISGCVSAISDNTDVTVFPTPIANVTVNGNTMFCEGSSVTLHVDATPAYLDYTYQWYMDNMPIPGATAADYVVAEPARSTPYNFYVVVSANSSYDVTAYAPDITIVADPVVTAIISEDIICAGGTVTLTAFVNGGVININGNGYDIEWYRNTSTSTELVGTGSSYITDGTEVPNNYTYWVTANNSYGCNASSDSVILSVVADPQVVITVADGYPTTVCDGGSTVIKANATGGYGEISYQWYKNGYVLAGETNQTLATNNLYSGVNDNYTVAVTQTGAGCSNSASADINTLVTVYPAYTVDIISPNNICEGGTLTLISAVNNAIPGDMLNYQWHEIINGQDILIYDANSETYTTANLQLGNSYDYYVVVNGSFPGCSATSASQPVNVNAISQTALYEITCEDYIWNGVPYTETGDYTQTFTDANGCDSVVTLHLTVNHGTHNVETETTCESYTWHGVTYTTSGTYTYEYNNASGCASVDTLHLTVNHGTHNVETDTACESYEWHGTEYNTSGTYTYEYNNASGCASADTLLLTINFAQFAQFADTACDSYTWNDETYVTSGDYTQSFTNAVGCDSVVTLHLTVYPTQETEFTITTEDSCYIWNSQTYCTSGDYTQTLQTIDGCDSVVTLHLTVSVGIDDHNPGASMTVYPNPTTGVVNVECTRNNVQVGKVEFQLFDAFGRLLRSTDGMTDTHSSYIQTVQIDLSHFAAGVYFIKAVADGNVIAVRKVVKR